MSSTTTTRAPRRQAERRHAHSLPDDVQTLPWAARQLGVGLSTAYRLAASGKIPGQFRVGGLYRISVPRFWREVHGEAG